MAMSFYAAVKAAVKNLSTGGHLSGRVLVWCPMISKLWYLFVWFFVLHMFFLQMCIDLSSSQQFFWGVNSGYPSKFNIKSPRKVTFQPNRKPDRLPTPHFSGSELLNFGSPGGELWHPSGCRWWNSLSSFGSLGAGFSVTGVTWWCPRISHWKCLPCPRVVLNWWCSDVWLKFWRCGLVVFNGSFLSFNKTIAILLQGFV